MGEATLSMVRVSRSLTLSALVLKRMRLGTVKYPTRPFTILRHEVQVCRAAYCEFAHVTTFSVKQKQLRVLESVNIDVMSLDIL
jgi:hypothetical protein